MFSTEILVGSSVAAFLLGATVGRQTLSALFGVIASAYARMVKVLHSPRIPMRRPSTIEESRSDSPRPTAVSVTRSRRSRRRKNAYAAAWIGAAAVVVAAIINIVPDLLERRRPALDPALPNLAEYSDSASVIFSPRGQRSIYGTEGNYYKLSLSGRLHLALDRGNIIFPIEEVTLRDILDYRSGALDVPAWDHVISRLNTVVRETGTRANYYIFVEGAADSALIGNSELFGDIGPRNVAVGQFLRENPAVADLLKSPVYYFTRADTPRRTEIIASPRPHAFRLHGYANEDLPFLRAAFVRGVFTNNAPTNFSFPVGVIQGEIADRRDPQYRTSTLYLFQTRGNLETAMRRAGVPFEQYFAQ